VGRGALVGLLLAVLLLAAPHAQARLRAVDAHPARAVATITAGAPATKLPRSFFGLSVEYPELPMYEQFLPSFERILGLLKVGDDGPQVLRVGGNSADLTFWNPQGMRLPRDAYVLSSQWFSQFATLILQSRLRVLLDLNLKTSTASQARGLVKEALARFPAGSIAGLEFGNEPDQYGGGYSPARYVQAFKAYAHAVGKTAPSVPFLGPAVTSTDNNFNWLQAVATGDRSQLGVLDGHEYPLAACENPGDPGYPTVEKILSASLISGYAASVKPAVVLAHRAHRPFRLDETNSVTCGGSPGVSDTFATALWAPDALFSLLRTGLDAVNFHIRPTKINGPLALGTGGFIARPLFYGLLLFARMASPGGQLLRVSQTVPPSSRLSAWAVKVTGGAIHVLLINKASSALTVRLRLRSRSAAVVERLLAPSARAADGVTFGGQKLGADGIMKGMPVSEMVASHGGSYQVKVGPTSAVLVEVQR